MSTLTHTWKLPNQGTVEKQLKDFLSMSSSLSDKLGFLFCFVISLLLKLLTDDSQILTNANFLRIVYDDDIKHSYSFWYKSDMNFRLTMMLTLLMWAF